jgi:hypothetical protein
MYLYKKFFLFCLIFIGSISISSPQKVVIYGYIRDVNSGEPLPYSTCLIRGTGHGVAANDAGYYNIKANKGTLLLEASYVGYRTLVVELYAHRDTTLNFLLEPMELAEVQVSAQRQSLLIQSLSGKVTVPLQNIQAVPAFGGEADILKSLTYLPGVTGGRDGYSTLLVRGGNPDQNLMLLDGCPVFNVSHLGGFVSLFNPIAVKHVDLYKNSYPSQYGGRASSVLDVKLRDGSKEKVKGELFLGILSSGFLVEGPLIKGKSSFLISARTSNFYFLNANNRRELKETGQGNSLDYIFYDINARFNSELDKKTKIYFSIYSGGDYIDHQLIETGQKINNQIIWKEEALTKSSISNQALTLGVNRVIGTNLYGNFYSYLSLYNQNDIIEKNDIDIPIIIENKTDKRNGIAKYGIASRFDYQTPLSNLKLTFGFDLGSYSIIPDNYRVYRSIVIDEYSNIIDTTFGGNLKSSPLDFSIFVDNTYNVTKKLLVKGGIRFNYFVNNHFRFTDLEPRLSIRYLPTTNHAFGISYSIVNQYIHGITTRDDFIEKMLWFSASDEFAPQKANQYSASLNGVSNWQNFDYGVEIFYKKMNNLPDIYGVSYRNLSVFAENRVISGGIGDAYGLEIHIQKQTPIFLTAFAYTLSQSKRQIKEINSGEVYPSDFDRLHDFSWLMQFHYSEKISYGFMFIAHSGTPFSLPVGRVRDNPFTYSYNVFDGVNSHRMPIYHRLDVSVKRNWDTRFGRKKYIAVSIFNTYAKINPTSVVIENGKFKKKSYLTIVPSVSFHYEF